MSKDLYGNVEGFDDQPKKKRQTAPRAQKSKKKSKSSLTDISLDIFKIERSELTESEKQIENEVSEFTSIN